MVSPSLKDVSCVKNVWETRYSFESLFYVGGTFPLLVSYSGLTGGQLISITATGTDGARVESRISFDIPSKPHPQLVCTLDIHPFIVEVDF